MDKPFIMKNNEGCECALKKWLKSKKYNAWSHGSTDKRGQPLIGLSWEHRPDSDWSKYDRAGLIICADIEAQRRALKVLDMKHEKKEQAA